MRVAPRARSLSLSRIRARSRLDSGERESAAPPRAITTRRLATNATAHAARRRAERARADEARAERDARLDDENKELKARQLQQWIEERKEVRKARRKLAAEEDAKRLEAEAD